MDFNNRELKPQTAATNAPASTTARRSSSDRGKWARIGVVAAVAAVVILLLAVIALAAGNKNESQYVKSDKLQAVFLNTGQVYFGNIKTANSKYFVLSNIYYLQTANSNGSSAASNTNSNVSLVKLGCELHEPFDQMVINRDQVTFWENLQDNGQVAKAVATFKQQNPQGQKCTDQSSSASNSSVNNAQNAGTGTSNTSNTTNTTTPKANP